MSAVLPDRKLRRRRLWLRISLALLGFVQWALAIPAMFGDSMAMPMGIHAAHEGAAWNLALGASFLAVAVRPVRAVGTIPILATFVAVLGALTVPDIAAGLVETGRLVSHAGVVAGLVLVALMSRSTGLLPPQGEVTSGDGSQDSVHLLRGDRGVA
jgi:predicted anti-sigma-YlaC factor YlaD